MDGNVSKIEITLDNGRKLVFLPRFNSDGDYDAEFLFNGPDQVDLALNIGAMMKDENGELIEPDRRKASLKIDCVIATDRITID
jgi:hypothetical protein